MKKVSKIIAIIIISVLSVPVFAGETVNWIGILNESDGYHYIGHKFGHDLQFVRQSDGKKFTIINNKELIEAHRNSEKNLLVQIQAEITPKFLFWGENLSVKDFKILSELSEISHKKYEKPLSSESTFGKHNR